MNKTSYSTRFSYAASDVAGQLVFTFIIGGYLSKFLTDIYGLSAITCGTIIAIARWIDAVDAPVWGIVFDKTRSRLGKSRPWFLWLCVPFATFGVLTFQTPDLSHTAKVWYAAVTYIVCNILYTGINTPVTSILSGLTADPQERVTLTCFRMFGSKLGVLIVNLTALKMVQWLGQGDDRRGFMLALPVYAAGSIFFYLLAFRNLKEVVPVEKKSEPVLGTFRALKGNWPWLIIFSSSLLFWIGFIARVSTVPYYFQYVLHREDLIWLAYSLDFVSLATAFLLPWVCRWTSKRTAWALGLMGMVLGQLILYGGVSQGAFHPFDSVRLDGGISRQRHGDGNAVFDFIGQRGLRRMEDRRPRGGLADRRGSLFLSKSRGGSGRRHSALDHGKQRLCSEY